MITLYLIELGLLTTHIATYRHHFTDMFFTYAITFACKKLIKSMDESEKASMVGLAGYSLVLAQFIKYIAEVKTAGKTNALRPELNLQEKGQLPIQDIIKNAVEAIADKFSK